MWIRGKELPDRLYRHELEHCYQVKRKGRLKFYFTYLVLLVRYGNQNHPYEVEAEEAETKPLLPIEQQWKDTGVVRL
jgi:hypothetical protein